MNRVDIFIRMLDKPSAAIRVDREHIGGVFGIKEITVKESTSDGFWFDVYLDNCLIQAHRISLGDMSYWFDFNDSPYFINEKVNEWLRSKYEWLKAQYEVGE